MACYNLVWDHSLAAKTAEVITNPDSSELGAPWGTFSVLELPFTAAPSSGPAHTILFSCLTERINGGDPVPTGAQIYAERQYTGNFNNPQFMTPGTIAAGGGGASSQANGNKGGFLSLTGTDRCFFLDTRVTITATVDGLVCGNSLIAESHTSDGGIHATWTYSVNPTSGDPCPGSYNATITEAGSASDVSSGAGVAPPPPAPPPAPAAGRILPTLPLTYVVEVDTNFKAVLPTTPF